LIISVDHGITKVEEIKYAIALGIKIIVTDHHSKGGILPKKIEAIFHIPTLSGSGVAYFFAKEISKHFTKTAKVDKILINNFENDYLIFATIGTVADLVPLSGPSRSVVKHGLEAFKKIKRVGLKQIIKESGIENKNITPYEIGYMIAPRINAIGRLEHAIDALRLLCTSDEKKAQALSHKIGVINIERQDLVKKSVAEAKTMLKTSAAKIIILVSDHWHEGIIGLIASKIAEEFYRPTLVLTKTDMGYKGSARSIPSFHITNFLRSLKKNLIDVGGHRQAAGFTIKEKQLEAFTKNAQKLASKLIKDKDLEKIIEADIKIPISKITLKLVKSLEVLEPFGIGNPKPVFYSEGVLTGAQLLGKTQKHLKIFVDGLELIAFNQAEKFQELSRGQKIKVVYNLGINYWHDRETVQGKVIYSVIDNQSINI
jgi:single-stranded-DNA-specific exonuclease